MKKLYLIAICLVLTTVTYSQEIRSSSSTEIKIPEIVNQYYLTLELFKAKETSIPEEGFNYHTLIVEIPVDKGFYDKHDVGDALTTGAGSTTSLDIWYMKVRHKQIRRKYIVR